MRQKGWKPLPISLKILFVIYLISIVVGFFPLLLSLLIGEFPEIPFFGIRVSGIISLFLYSLMLFAGVAFLIVLWNRYDWGWVYGMVFLSFLVIDGLVSIIFDKSTFQNTTLIISALPGFIFQLIFLFVLYKHKKYFD